jgi:hypothetical protein
MQVNSPLMKDAWKYIIQYEDKIYRSLGAPYYRVSVNAKCFNVLRTESPLMFLRWLSWLKGKSVNIKGPKMNWQAYM